MLFNMFDVRDSDAGYCIQRKKQSLGFGYHYLNFSNILSKLDPLLSLFKLTYHHTNGYCRMNRNIHLLQ